MMQRITVLSCLLLSFFLLTGKVSAEEPASTPESAIDAVAGTPEENSAEAEASKSFIYLVVRIKLTGTDLTQVVFFRHQAITSMEACEAERNAGLTSGWQHFSRYYLKTLKGVSYKVDYRCVEGEQRLAYWQRGVPQNQFYLVRTTDNRLQVQSYRNFFECRAALRNGDREESIDSFCSISSQAISSTP